MKVLCAWCEQEGKQALIRESESNAHAMVTHGICEHHESILRKQVEMLTHGRRHDPLRPRLLRRSSVAVRVSSLLPAFRRTGMSITSHIDDVKVH